MSKKTPPPPPGFPPLPPPPPIDDSNDKEIKQKNDDLDIENTDISNITDDLSTSFESPLSPPSEQTPPPPPGFTPPPPPGLTPPPPPGFTSSISNIMVEGDNVNNEIIDSEDNLISPSKETDEASISDPNSIVSDSKSSDDISSSFSQLLDNSVDYNEISTLPDNSEPERKLESLKSLADSLSIFSDKSNVDEPYEEESSDSDVESTTDSFSIMFDSDEQQFAVEKESKFSMLRPSIEVDSIPGDKLHAILKESEVSSLNPNGSVRNQSIKGELILRNASKKHRAWDIEIQLKNTDSTDFGDAIIPIRELDATEEKIIKYNAQGPRMVIMTESIDTDSERNEESSLSLVYLDNPQDILISIELENVDSDLVNKAKQD